MLNSLLTVTSELSAEGYPKKVGVGEGAIDALLGFIVVFIGIAFLVGVIWLVGFIMRKTTGKEKRRKISPEESKKEESGQVTATEGTAETTSEIDFSEETLAVITAAIMAYYAEKKPGCGFTVKRIKRI